MSPLSQTMLATFVVLTCTMFVLWVIGTWSRDVSIVDPFWGTGFVLTAWLVLWLNGSTNSRVLLLVCLVTIWGLRLSLFLLWRNWEHGEDRRYTAMRDYHGQGFWWISLFSVFLLQGVILWFVSMPIQFAVAKNSSQSLGWLDVVGTLFWTLGLVFEVVGDWQLAQFKANETNRSKVMDQGLWRYTRHPNYFGDFCVWWGLYLIAAAGGAVWTAASPLLMSFLLLRISGVTLLEKGIIDRRPDYAAYQARTSSFLPWPPRNSDSDPLCGKQ